MVTWVLGLGLRQVLSEDRRQELVGVSSSIEPRWYPDAERLRLLSYVLTNT